MKRHLISAALVCLIASAEVEGSNDATVSTVSRDDGSGLGILKKKPTTRDAIELTIPGYANYAIAGWTGDEVASYSPDGSRFTVVVQRGDIDTNSNIYSLLLWRVSDIQAGIFQPTSIVEMRSTSNLPAIRRIKWAADNETVWFVGSNADKAQQVYTLNTRTHQLRAVTSHPTDVLDFAVDAYGDRLAYVAKRPPKPLWNEKTLRNGIVISEQPNLDLSDLILGYHDSSGLFDLDVQTDLFYLSRDEVTLVPTERSLPPSSDIVWGGRVSISPDGKLLLVTLDTPAAEIPSEWRNYIDEYIQNQLLYSGTPEKSALNGLGQSPWTFLERHELIDIQTGQSTTLVDAPVSLSGKSIDPVWSPSGSSVVISRTFLPLDVNDPTERSRRVNTPVTVEVSLETGKAQPIGSGCSYATSWNASSDELTCTTDGPGGETVRLRKRGGSWRPVAAGKEFAQAPKVSFRENMYSPPKLYIRDGSDHGETLLFDPNPQLSELSFGKLEEISWEWTRGRRTQAGLYYPSDYSPERRYGLVIQSHGWTRDRFEMEGFETSGYAARALAARGLVVAQVADIIDSGVVTPREEIENAIQVYRTLVELLSKKGVIDPKRVGIVGFSRTTAYVTWALTRYPTLFAAATSGETTGGYMSYMSRLGVGGMSASALYGGPPLGENLKKWTELLPAFNLDRVRTPIRIALFNPKYLLSDWEWYEGLRLQKKPVEMIMVRNGFHMLRRPAERMVVSEGNVDWFDFWLDGHEDADPSKKAQYARWRAMKTRSR